MGLAFPGFPQIVLILQTSHLDIVNVMNHWLANHDVTYYLLLEFLAKV